MSDINRGIYERMANDATLTSYLAIYRGSPAIFLVRPVPTDCEFPFIVADEDINVTPWDTKTFQGRTILRSIKVYTQSSTGTRTLSDDIIERVRFLFHRQATNISISGYRVIIADAQTGGEFLPVDNRVYGQEIEVSLTIQKC